MRRVPYELKVCYERAPIFTDGTQIGLGRTQNATDLLDLDYSYGTTQNNGNVLSQTITVPTVGSNTGFTAVHTYNYDPLNRLKDATEMITPHGGSQTQSWKQTYQFDRYGNRRFDFTSGATTTPESNCPPAVCDPAIDPNTNKITSTGYAFDAAGNTTRDAQDRKFTYDAENKQVKVESLSPGTNTVTGTITSGIQYRKKDPARKPGRDLSLCCYEVRKGWRGGGRCCLAYAATFSV